MLTFLGLKKKPSFSFDTLSVDIHSHLIPGIDDGAKTLAESLSLVKSMRDLGFKKIITTPHVMSDYFPNSREIILAGLSELQSALAENEINIPVEVAAEYFVDENFFQLLSQDQPLLTLPGNYVLIELSTLVESDQIMDIVFQLNTKRYHPILAHPERYLYYDKKFDIFYKLKELGCKFQVNLLSLVGHYGKEQKTLARKLLDKGLVDFLGSDVHHQGHVALLRKFLHHRYLQKYLSGKQFLNSSLL